MTAVNAPGNTGRDTSISVVNSVMSQGVGDAGWFYVGIYLSTDQAITTSDTRLTMRYVSALAAGANSSVVTSVFLPSTTTAGTYYIGAIADYSSVRLEADETNNALTGSAISITN